MRSPGVLYEEDFRSSSSNATHVHFPKISTAPPLQKKPSYFSSSKPLCYYILVKIIDVHTHGLGGHDTRTPDKKEILAIAAAHGALGVAGIVPAIYPAAIKVMRKHMDAVRKAMELQKTGAHTKSRIIGVHLEGPFLNPLQCGALDATAFLEPTEYHLQKLIEGFEDMVKIITVAPELKGAAGIIRKIADKGIIPSMGHSAATYIEAENG